MLIYNSLTDLLIGAFALLRQFKLLQVFLWHQMSASIVIWTTWATQQTPPGVHSKRERGKVGATPLYELKMWTFLWLELWSLSRGRHCWNWVKCLCTSGRGLMESLNQLKNDLYILTEAHRSKWTSCLCGKRWREVCWVANLWSQLYTWSCLGL